MRKLNIKKYKVLLIIVILILANHFTVKACEACGQNQPKILKGITHGNGPQSNWDYFIVVVMILVTIYSLYATVKCFIKPTERKYSNIKNAILNQQ